MTKKKGVVEPDGEFYSELEGLTLKLSEAEHDLVFYTEGLSAMEKEIMAMVDSEYYAEHNKRMPEYLQRREAKTHPKYRAMIRAKANAQRQKTLFKGLIEVKKMQFEEWRTRSADRRHTI